MSKLKYLFFFLALGALSCTDARCAKLGNLGNSGAVTCYSGGKLIYEGSSTGKIISEANSDGYFFKEASTGNLMEVSGNCVITYK